MMRARRLIARGPKDRPHVALTFDDGPHPEITPRLLDVLDRRGARATFFLVGERVLRWPELAARIAGSGHAVGSHGFAHRRDWWRSTKALGDDLDRAEQAIGESLAEPKLFRPPFGVLSPTWYLAARRRGYTCVLWSVASHDWKTTDVEYVARRVTVRLKPGALIALHECRARTGEGFGHTVEVVDRCLSELTKRGLEAVSVGSFLTE